MSWDSPLYEDMRKQGPESFSFERIEVVENNKGDLKEQYWIEELRTLYPDGYNLTSGGEKGKIYSDITKSRIGETTKERWDDPKQANRMRKGLEKAGIKKGYIRIPREKRSCKECFNEFECLETSDQIYCSQKCALPDIRKRQKELYVEERQSVHKMIKTYAEVWAMNNKDLILNCPLNKIKTNLEPMIDEIESLYDVKDYRVISKAISGKESRKEMLKYLKEYIE